MIDNETFWIDIWWNFMWQRGIMWKYWEIYELYYIQSDKHLVIEITPLKENKMSWKNSQCRGLIITSLKMGTCITTFLDWGLLKKKQFFSFWGAPKYFFWSPKPLKVVTHVPIFRLVIVSTLHWPFVRDILFSLYIASGGVWDAKWYKDIKNFLLTFE